MYVPKYAAVENLKFIHEFVDKNSFGVLCTQSADEVSANHFPFLLDRSSGDGVLWTHMARSNPQWQALRKESSCLAIFRGPHAYISPSLYVEKLNVPTWNYTAVHARGSAEVFEDYDSIEDILVRTVDHFEQSNPNPWKYDLPADFKSKLVKAIVGVKLTVNHWDGKFKLSQNRDRDDYQEVLREFSMRTDDNSRELLRYMKETTPEHLK